MIMEGRDFLKRSDLSVGEVNQLKTRLAEAEAELARLRAVGTFNEGIEAAAAVAETWRRRKLGRDLSKATWDPCGRWEGGEIMEEGTARELIAKAISSLLRPDDGGK